ncbi:C-type lectin 37Db-like [Topomyia yanbarensis]|uniref:C-type lectin 37Db-like n=1 Tax=Topomyia yanbarensis TaxID=2498891 RepID=UPI00273B3863|nr:C-type lectin 37Db-like [Topomyia yanbarensis]
MQRVHFTGLIFFIIFAMFFHYGSQTAPKKYHIPNFRTNWHKANEFCNSIGMRLLTIRSREENDAVAQFVQSTDKFNDVQCYFWIGGSDLGEEGVFSWVATGKLVTFTNWSPGEPNNNNGTEDCMQMVFIPRFAQRWTWNDNNCKGSHMYFICEDATDCVMEF